jgi:hypothetical protein
MRHAWMVTVLAGAAWAAGASGAWAQAGRAYTATPKGCIRVNGACPASVGLDPRRVGGMNDPADAEPDVMVSEDAARNRAFAINDNEFAVGAGPAGLAIWGFPDYRGRYEFFTLPQIQQGPQSPGVGTYQLHDSEAWALTSAFVAVGTSFYFRDTDPSKFPYPTMWTRSGVNFTATRLRTALFPADHPLFPGQPKPGTARDVNEAGTVVGSQDGRACLFRTGQDPLVLTAPKGTRYLETTGIADDGSLTGAGEFNVGTALDPDYQLRAFVRGPATLPGPGPTPEMTAIPLPRSVFDGSRAWDINSAGLAVGTVLQTNGGTNGAVWTTEGRVALLNANVDRTGLVELMRSRPATADVTAIFLNEAIDVNESGEILALGSVTREPEGAPVRREIHAFVLTPTGDPLAFVLYTY